MELRHLRYLVAIAEERSFLQAARRLRVAQSALSKQIADLEREIGVKLFHRAPRGVRLTAGGAVFLREAKKALEHADQAVAGARQVEDGAESVLHLGHGAFVVHGAVVLDLITDFRQEYPENEIEIHYLDEVGQRKALLDHEIDMTATFLAGPVDEAFDCLSLVDCYATGALLPADHPLAFKERIHVNELADLTYLAPSKQAWPDFYGAIMNGLEQRGLVVKKQRVLPTDAHTANFEIGLGGAWSLGNEAIGAHYGAMTNTIVFRQFIEEPLPFELGLVWRRGSLSRLGQALVEIGRNHCPSTMTGPRHATDLGAA